MTDRKSPMLEQARKHPRITTIAAVLGILGTLLAGGRYLLTPWFATAASNALAAETDKRIDAKLTPAMAATDTKIAAVKADVEKVKTKLSGMDRDKLSEMTDEVALQEFRKTRDQTWSQVDELKLSQLKQRVQAVRERIAEGG